MRFWHYTTVDRLHGILRDGAIRRARVGVKLSGSRPAVWFSTRATWEPTATKGVAPDWRLATITEMVTGAGGLVRIEVSADVARHTWATHRQRHEIAAIADTLEADARERGADPADWRVSYHDVPVSKVLSIEVSEDGDAWQRWTMKGGA